MEGPIVVTTTGIESSPKVVVGSSHAMDLKDVRYVRLTRRMSFLELVKRLRINESIRFAIEQTRRRRVIWIKKD
jgi:hypothetical protein